MKENMYFKMKYGSWLPYINALFIIKTTFSEKNTFDGTSWEKLFQLTIKISPAVQNIQFLKHYNKNI